MKNIGIVWIVILEKMNFKKCHGRHYDVFWTGELVGGTYGLGNIGTQLGDIGTGEHRDWEYVWGI